MKKFLIILPLILIIIPMAFPNDITTSPTTKATIESTCFFPFPRTSDFCKIAKTTAKTSKNGSIISIKNGVCNIVAM